MSTPIARVEKLRPREFRSLAQGHTIGKGQRWYFQAQPCLAPLRTFLGVRFPGNWVARGCKCYLCNCVTGVCLCISGCVCDSGLVYLCVCVLPCVYGSECSSGEQGELRAGGTRPSTGVLREDRRTH